MTAEEVKATHEEEAELNAMLQAESFKPAPAEKIVENKDEPTPPEPSPEQEKLEEKDNQENLGVQIAKASIQLSLENIEIQKEIKQEINHLNRILFNISSILLEGLRKDVVSLEQHQKIIQHVSTLQKENAEQKQLLNQWNQYYASVQNRDNA